MRDDLGNPNEVNAMMLESGQELEKFQPSQLVINKQGLSSVLVPGGFSGK